MLMCTNNRNSRQRGVVVKRGRGIFNKVLQKLPFELHVPGYRFCGPGTKLEQRLARGEVGINKLDEACRRHDIAYSQYTDLDERHKADQVLAQEAAARITAKDSGWRERATALGIKGAMKTKVKLGLGVANRMKKGKGLSFRAAVNKARKEIEKQKPFNDLEAAKVALNSIKRSINKRKKNPRVIKIPKSGGFLIPLFAGLSALGALAGGAANIAKTANEAKAAAAELKEKQRHNIAMEKNIPIGKGLYLKPYKTGGLGLYLKPFEKN